MSKRVRDIDTSAEHEPAARGGEPAGTDDADADATALLALGGEDDAHDDAQHHEESEAKRARHGQGHHHEMHHEDAEMASAAAAAAEALADVHHNPHDEHRGSHHQGHHGGQHHGGQHGSHHQQYDPAHYQQHHQAYYGHHQQHHGQHPHYDYSAYAHPHPHEQQHHSHDQQHAEAHQYHHPHHQEQQHQHQHEGHAQAQAQAHHAHHAHAASAAAAGEPSAANDADAAPAAAHTTTHASAEASRDTKWSEMIDHLTTYATTNGHCDVPGRQPRLGPWVQIQRAQYRLYRDGKPSALTADKVAKLEELGFRWQIARDRDSVWTEMLERWLALRGSGKTNGGARVGQDPKLASWCKRQRKTYRLLGEGKPTPMKPEWAERLREVGFDFGDGASSAAAAGAAAAAMSAAGTAMDGSGGEEEEEGAAKPAAAADTNADANTDAAATAESIAAAGSATARDDDGTFQLRLAEVKQFVADHGPGVAIPDAYPSNEALGRWATQKRKQKRRADAGHTTRLTADRIAALDEAGFVWQVWGNRTEKWDEMFGRLVEFREQHGGSTRIVHSLRAKDPDLRQLGMWCDRQRAAYKARQQGKSGPMTDDRAKRLDDIG